LHIQGKDRKVVFLMGAGATRGAIKHVMHNGKRVKPPLNGDFFDVAHTFARGCGTNSPDMKRYQSLDRFFKNTLPFSCQPTMEEAFSNLYIAKDFPDIYRTGRGRTQQPGHRSEIEEFLRLTFNLLTLLDQKTNTSVYDKLITSLSGSDTIITLNYDTLLDSALVRAGWDPRKGYLLGGTEQKIEWKPKERIANSSLAGVKLLKLHGSLNWYVRGNFHSLSRVFENKPVKIGQPRRNEIRGHIRQIVPPIYGKFFGHSHWRQLWKKGYEALCDAEILVVIGCSLVDTDFHLRLLLSRTSQYRKSFGNLFRRLILVDNSVQVRRKWKAVLKGTRQEVSEYKRFEEFVSKELRI